MFQNRDKIVALRDDKEEIAVEFVFLPHLLRNLMPSKDNRVKGTIKHFDGTTITLELSQGGSSKEILFAYPSSNVLFITETKKFDKIFETAKANKK